METLANLALAAAKLEEAEGETGYKMTGEENPAGIGHDFLPPESRVVRPPPPPMRQSFITTPRLVSMDSTSCSPKQLASPSIDILPEGEDPTLDLDAELEHPPLPPSPTEVITRVQEDDVLCGRGGETNHHTGNVRYRALVKHYQRVYLKAKRRDKPRIARLIVDTVRRRGGRFLKKDLASSNYSKWRDVGNSKAREKTSQALREGAPEIRNDVMNDGSSASWGEAEQVESSVKIKMPRVVEITSSSQPQKKGKKRRKLSVNSSSFEEMQSTLVSPTSSMGFVATVSTDDDSAEGEHEQTGKEIRGPRLAILKKRLSMSG